MCCVVQLLSCPRILHSFPTRRSSDLSPDFRAGTARDGVPPVAHPPTRDPRRGRAEAATKLLACWASGPHEDRKSTRLNSSHRCISYAVFCLNKKTAGGERRHEHHPRI